MVEDEQENSHKEKQELKLKEQKNFHKEKQKSRACAITNNSSQLCPITYSPTQTPDATP